MPCSHATARERLNPEVSERLPVPMSWAPGQMKNHYSRIGVRHPTFDVVQDKRLRLTDTPHLSSTSTDVSRPRQTWPTHRRSSNWGTSGGPLYMHDQSAATMAFAFPGTVLLRDEDGNLQCRWRNAALSTPVQRNGSGMASQWFPSRHPRAKVAAALGLPGKGREGEGYSATGTMLLKAPEQIRQLRGDMPILL